MAPWKGKIWLHQGEQQASCYSQFPELADMPWAASWAASLEKVEANLVCWQCLHLSHKLMHFMQTMINSYFWNEEMTWVAFTLSVGWRRDEMTGLGLSRGEASLPRRGQEPSGCGGQVRPSPSWQAPSMWSEWSPKSSHHLNPCTPSARLEGTAGPAGVKIGMGREEKGRTVNGKDSTCKQNGSDCKMTTLQL